jgi:diacylglycerol kinase (ATP)
MSSPSVDVIVNGRAGRMLEGSALRRSFCADARDRGARVHSPGDLEALDAVTRDILGRGTDAIVVAGGDGTAMAVLSTLVSTWPKGRPLPAIAFAGGGTVCTVARNLGAHGTGDAWARRVLRATCEGRAAVRLTPTLRVRDCAGGDRIGFIFAAGLVARFFAVYDASPKRGVVTAATLASRVFAGSLFGSAFANRMLAPVEARLAVDGVEQASRAWSLLVASVVRDAGLHLRATYRAGEALDRFHAVACGSPARALAAQLPRVLAGRPLTAEPRVDVLARSLSVEFPGDRGSYVLDGDLLAARSVAVGAGPCVRVLVPAEPHPARGVAAISSLERKAAL